MSGRLFGLDVYDPVLTELFREDRLSILALQHALRAKRREYSYLEIGSHLGGSLQPFLRDPACRAAYSIDPRPLSQPDARGVSFHYPENSTARMLDTLRPAYREALAKLRTFDLDARDVPSDQIELSPDLCFIDGEDTDGAARSDFESCLRLGRSDAVIVFSNLQLIFGGFQRCLELLDERGVPYRAYALPLKLGVIELGASELWRDPVVHDRLASVAAPLFIAENLAHYRDGILALQRLPGARLARRVLIALGLGRGLEPRANPRAGEFSRKSDGAVS